MTSIDVSVDGQIYPCCIAFKPVRKLTLKAHPKYGLQCISPKRFSHSDIHAFIDDNQSWLARQSPVLAMAKQYASDSMAPPSQITLPCFEQTWSICYHQAHRSPRYQWSSDSVVHLYSNGQAEPVRALLLKWLRSQVIPFFHDRLSQHAQLTGLSYSGLSIGQAGMRWGSCRHDNHIRLNLMLAFLPAHYVDHVMLHELCHTRHHNHSAEFWELLKQLDPKTLLVRKQLRQLQWGYEQIPPFFW